MHLKHSNVNIETEMHCAIIYVFAYRKTSFHNKKSMRKLNSLVLENLNTMIMLQKQLN